MASRFLRWWHRSAAPEGRHVRVLPVVTVPGAAATIVGTASLDPHVTGAWSALDSTPAREPERVVTPASAAPRAPGGPASAVPVTSTVGLVFADGQSVELHADDPRVRTFRAAAEALVEHQRG